MSVRLVIGATLLWASLAAGETALFEDAPPMAEPRAPVFEDAARLQQQASKLRFVVDATPTTLGEKWAEAIKLLDAAITEAANAGDTARHDALIARRAEVAAAAESAKKTPMLPSLYPLKVAKKGALYAVREQDLLIRSGKADAKPLALPVQVISWFSVKVLETKPDGGLLCEIYENSGKILLYKAVLSGMDNAAMKPGVTAQLVNAAFECTAAEQTDTGTLYYLTKTTAEAVGVLK